MSGRCSPTHIRHMHVRLVSCDLIRRCALLRFSLGRAVALSIAKRHLRQIGELLLDSLVWIVHAGRSLPLHVLARALSNAPLLLSRVGECRTVVRLATRLCRALLVLSTDEGIDVSCVLLLGCHLRLLVEALWPVALLDACHGQIMVVSLEKLLNAGPLELGLVLEHLLGVRVLPPAVRVLGIEVVFFLIKLIRSFKIAKDDVARRNKFQNRLKK